MPAKKRMSHIKPYLLLCIAILIYCSPQAVFDGASRALLLWSKTLVPSLLPFLILSDLLLNCGVIHRLGRLLEPIMRPVFHLPGACGFVVAMGFTSGFPTGALLSASLLRSQLCTNAQAARLIAFTNNSSPLFLLSAVSIGMLHLPQLGLLLLIAHYGANLFIGILLGVFSSDQEPDAMHHIKPSINDKPLAILLGESIQYSLKSMFQIGGFVLIFSVLLAICNRYCLLLPLKWCICHILQCFGLDRSLTEGLSLGFFEMTLGIQSIAQQECELYDQLLGILLLLGFSGISVHAQIYSICVQNAISARIYFICRPLQAILSVLLMSLLIHTFPLYTDVLAPLTRHLDQYPLSGRLFLLCFPLLLMLFYASISVLWRHLAAKLPFLR